MGKGFIFSVLCISAIGLLGLSGCGQDERILQRAGTYVLESQYAISTLELKPDGSYEFEQVFLEGHPFQGTINSRAGRWNVVMDRLDREGQVIPLTPSPPNITRLVVNEQGDLWEFTSNDVYLKQQP